MAWTSPRTWVPGERPSASTLNTHVRDNLDYLYSVVGVLTGARVVGSGTQTIGTGAWTKVTILDTETWDTGSEFASDRYTANAAKKVEVFANAYFPTNGTPRAGCHIYKNGAGTHMLGMAARAASNATSVVAHGQISLALNDYLEMYVYQDSGGNHTLDGTGVQFSVRKIGS